MILYSKLELSCTVYHRFLQKPCEERDLPNQQREGGTRAVDSAQPGSSLRALLAWTALCHLTVQPHLFSEPISQQILNMSLNRLKLRVEQTQEKQRHKALLSAGMPQSSQPSLLLGFRRVSHPPADDSPPATHPWWAHSVPKAQRTQSRNPLGSPPSPHCLGTVREEGPGKKPGTGTHQPQGWVHSSSRQALEASSVTGAGQIPHRRPEQELASACLFSCA